MTVISSRIADVGAEEVAEFIFSAGFVVHIIEDRSVDPVELRIVRSSPTEQEVVFSTTAQSMTMMDLIKLIRNLGYQADFERVV